MELVHFSVQSILYTTKKDLLWPVVPIDPHDVAKKSVVQ